MNPLLSKLQPYPFERLRRLFEGVKPNADFAPISLGIGEPKHATPAFIKEALAASMATLAAYPATAGVACLGSPMPRLMGAKSALGLTPSNRRRSRSKGYGWSLESRGFMRPIMKKVRLLSI